MVEGTRPLLIRDYEAVDRLVFATAKIEQKIRAKTARIEKKRGIRRFNDWTAALFKEAVEQGIRPKLVLKKVNPIVGVGIFAEEAIGALTYIGEYAGLVKKRQRFRDRHNNFVFGYVIGLSETPYVIDAREKGNFTRFINHSYEPNLLSRWFIHDGFCHIIFFTKRSILAGEQLTYDYGPYYWRKRSYPENL